MKKVFPIMLCLLMVMVISVQQTMAMESIMGLQYAKGFQITYLDHGIKKVTDGEGRTLILIPRGQQVPAKYQDETIIFTPVKKVITTSLTQTCLLRPLGQLDSISGVTVKEDSWYINKIKDGLEKGRITYIGTSLSPDYEKIKQINPDLVFVYTGKYGQQDLIVKLKELGINYAVNNDYMEAHPLGRMEWIKFLAAFYNEGDKAEAYYNKAVNSVQKLKKQIPNTGKPQVAWSMIYQGNIYVPNGGSFVAKMIDIAGGNYLFKDLKPDSTGSSEVSIEEFYKKVYKADVLMYSSFPSYVSSINDIVKQAPVLAEVKPIVRHNVWCYQPWYYQTIDKTHQVLEDLAALFYPQAFKDHKIKNYIQLPIK